MKWVARYFQGSKPQEGVKAGLGEWVLSICNPRFLRSRCIDGGISVMDVKVGVGWHWVED